MNKKIKKIKKLLKKYWRLILFLIIVLETIFILINLDAILAVFYSIKDLLVNFYTTADDDKKITVTVEIITLTIVVTGLYLFYRRIKNQDKDIKLQSFTTAINLLGSNESFARTGAIYALYHLACDDTDKKYRQQIAQILCSHIRSKTQEKEYQEIHKCKPSNEIHTCINLLFKENGLYDKFETDLDKADLSNAHLVGADFEDANSQSVIFKDT